MKYLLILTLSLFPFLSASATTLQITVHVGSSDSDPSFAVEDPDEVDDICGAVSTWRTVRLAMVPRPWYRMGYRGFHVADTAGGRHAVVYDMASAEHVLLRLSHGRIPPAVHEHVATEVARLESTTDFPLVPLSGHTAAVYCTPPVRGPGDKTLYDPNTDDCGLFVNAQGENNCYNYGSDIASNTFAKPGRGSGQIFDQNTCESVGSAALRDGLRFYGKTLPTGYPATGHYVALLIWRDYNFHWIRKDTDTNEHWSHKPGGTAVRNTDNNNDPIQDPSKADFSPWTVFCGYYVVVPSNATIG